MFSSISPWLFKPLFGAASVVDTRRARYISSELYYTSVHGVVLHVYLCPIRLRNPFASELYYSQLTIAASPVPLSNPFEASLRVCPHSSLARNASLVALCVTAAPHG